MLELYKTRNKLHIFIKIGKIIFRSYYGFTKRKYILAICN